ncbi:hypothetical protein [Klebsiella quasipneumoniae]|uniref:hypothetical protein n=2 Tax=Klebsiella TaxID=570 RepID=UPI001E50B5F9|nr:hypothetical protein [Klebsiella quasipneumoniae]
MQDAMPQNQQFIADQKHKVSSSSDSPPQGKTILNSLPQYSIARSTYVLSGASRSSSPPGGGIGNMESKLSRLESEVEHIKGTMRELGNDLKELRRDSRSDFRLLFGSLITVALGLAGLMAKGFHWL